MNCDTFNIKRECFFGKMNSIVPGFKNLSADNKIKTILCPKSSAAVKTANKFIRIMFLARDKINEGSSINTYPTMPVNVVPFCDEYACFSDWDDWDPSFLTKV